MIDHPTDCLCISCAPISTPTKSPTLNLLLGKDPHSALAHGLEKAHRAHVSEINRVKLLERCGVRAMP